MWTNAHNDLFEENVKTSARVFPCFTCELLRLLRKRFTRPFSDPNT